MLKLYLGIKKKIVLKKMKKELMNEKLIESLSAFCVLVLKWCYLGSHITITIKWIKTKLNKNREFVAYIIPSRLPLPEPRDEGALVRPRILKFSHSKLRTELYKQIQLCNLKNITPTV